MISRLARCGSNGCSSSPLLSLCSSSSRSSTPTMWTSFTRKHVWCELSSMRRTIWRKFDPCTRWSSTFASSSIRSSPWWRKNRLSSVIASWIRSGQVKTGAQRWSLSACHSQILDWPGNHRSSAISRGSECQRRPSGKGSIVQRERWMVLLGIRIRFSTTPRIMPVFFSLKTRRTSLSATMAQSFGHYRWLNCVHVVEWWSSIFHSVGHAPSRLRDDGVAVLSQSCLTFFLLNNQENRSWRSVIWSTRCMSTFVPLDEQTCDMIFGSWSHTSSLIHYQFWEKTPELPQYTPNNEWKLLAVTQSIKTIEYPNWVEPDTFFEINFSILIVRKPLQAIYNTVVPALMLTTLTLVSFFVSPIRWLTAEWLLSFSLDSVSARNANRWVQCVPPRPDVADHFSSRYQHNAGLFRLQLTLVGRCALAEWQRTSDQSLSDGMHVHLSRCHDLVRHCQ